MKTLGLVAHQVEKKTKMKVLILIGGPMPKHDAEVGIFV